MSQALEHVDRFDVSPEHQQDFQMALNGGLFEAHSSFASNPLLLTVLFLTHRRYKQIERRPHLFYEHVFDALCTRHDERKGGFERDLFSQLTTEDLIAAVELFCFITASKGELLLSRTSLQSTLSLVLSTLRIDADVAKLEKDLLQSISLLTEDGLDVTFIHRSLQEFMAARFVVNRLPTTTRLQGFAKIASEPSNSVAVSVVHALDPAFAEEVLLLPLLRQLLAFIDGIDIGHPRSYAKWFLTMRANVHTWSVHYPRPWDSPCDIRTALGLVSRMFGRDIEEASDGRTWWIDPKTTKTYKDEKLAISAGVQFFERTGHFGAAETIMPFSWDDCLRLREIWNQVESQRQVRSRTDSDITDLVSKLLDESS